MGLYIPPVGVALIIGGMVELVRYAYSFGGPDDAGQ